MSEIAGAGATVPVPFRTTDCGKPDALSAIDSEAVNVPEAAGFNSTETVQLAPIANEVPQVVVTQKEVAFVPVMVSDVSANAAVPEFFTVTICAAVVDPSLVAAKVRLAGVNVTDGAVFAAGQAFTRFATFSVPRP